MKRAAAFSLLAALAATGPALAQSGDAAAHCAALRQTDFSQVQDAPTQLQSAAISTLGSNQPPICKVEGYTLASDEFVLALPVQGWNGKYVQGGCGGACGITLPFWCNNAVKQGYACLGGDMGHRSSLADWQWARDDFRLKADFGFRSTHAMSLAGRAITQAYFGKPPAHRYFMGCSTGGRQAHVLAQRYPDDFDGIVAGAAPHSEIGSGLQLAWTVLANLEKSGGYILREKQATLLHDAVLKQCDMNDGVKDGLIGDPRLCHFDPGMLACKAGHAADDCLTTPQVTAARKMYAGPRDSHGRQIGTQGGVMPGSELHWIGDYMPRGNTPPQYVAFMTSVFRYLAFDPAPAVSWKLTDLDFDRDPARFGSASMLFDARNTDLRAFRDRGGKLLAFQGWEDTSVVPLGTLDFYDAVTREMGGLAKTQEFYRLFVVPGMRHCSSDSEGGDVIDYLSTISDWVEKGQPPEKLVGHSITWPGPITSTPIFPIPPAQIKKTRVVFPYPTEARYNSGDPNDPANWEPAPGLPLSPP